MIILMVAIVDFMAHLHAGTQQINSKDLSDIGICFLSFPVLSSRDKHLVISLSAFDVLQSSTQLIMNFQFFGWWNL